MYGEGGRDQGLGKYKGVGDNAVAGIGDGNGVVTCKEVVKVLSQCAVVPKIGVGSRSPAYREVNSSGALRKAVDVLQGGRGGKGKGLQYGISNKSSTSVGIGYEHGIVSCGKGVDVLGNGTVGPVVGIGSSATDHGKVNDSVVPVKASCRRGRSGKQERTCGLGKVVVPLGSTPVEVGHL